MSLSFDIARCDGFDCAKKLECARFMELHNRGEDTYVMDAPDGVCTFHIPHPAGQSPVSTDPAITTL